MSDKDPQRASRVMQALLQMRKIDIATLEQAAEGKVALSR
jgi:nitrate reductase NapAB chaperone NapD